MWPSVSSSSTPSPNQMMVVAPVCSRSCRSISARPSSGLRLWFSRHCSVVSSVPSPSTWIDPPSNTMGAR